jgi:hypothetical protein
MQVYFRARRLLPELYFSEIGFLSDNESSNLYQKPKRVTWMHIQQLAQTGRPIPDKIIIPKLLKKYFYLIMPVKIIKI